MCHNGLTIRGRVWKAESDGRASDSPSLCLRLGSGAREETGSSSKRVTEKL